MIQPKNISADGLISFGAGETLRTDAPSPRLLQANDVLVVNRGRFAAAVFDIADARSWIVPASVLVLSLSEPSVLPGYVACFFNSPAGQLQFQRHREQSTVPYIKASNLEEMEIPVPSLARQKSLIAFGKATAEYAYLSNRKQDLYRAILSQELKPKSPSSKKSTS